MSFTDFQGFETIGRHLKAIYQEHMDDAVDALNLLMNPAVPPAGADPDSLFDIPYLRRYYLGGSDTTADTPCLLISEEEPESGEKDAQGGFILWKAGVTVLGMDDGHGYERLNAMLWRFQRLIVGIASEHKCEAGYWSNLMLGRPVVSPPFPRGEGNDTLCLIQGAEFWVWSLEQF